MTRSPLDGLVAAETALIAALDANDIGAIEAAIPMLGTSVAELKLQTVWQQTPAILDHLRNALTLAEAARVRTRYLADRNQRRTDMLATAAGRFDCAPATYGRPARG